MLATSHTLRHNIHSRPFMTPLIPVWTDIMTDSSSPSFSMALFTDFYELTMAQGYFLAGRASQRARFDYFFRTNPFQGGHVIFAGLRDLITQLQGLRFSQDDLEYLTSLDFDPSFIDYLRGWSFQGNLRAVKEGEVVFPLEPIAQVEGDLVETQLIEPLLLNILNFESLVATKASRIALATQGRPFAEFGLRRAQGLGALHATHAAIIGGASSTSHVLGAKHHGVPPRGTIAHAWIQQFDDELDAFRAWAKLYPDDCVLLVDTYNTLNSGIPKAITVAKELAASNTRLKAIRLDSGDLAYLSKKARAMLDEHGLHDTQIYATNQLDEHLIKSLIDQGAPIDFFGVGTRLVTGHPDGALDGVYKLATRQNKPCLKISDNFTKVNLPGHKNLHRVLDEDGMFYGDAISLANEPTNLETIYHPYFPEQRSKIASRSQHDLLHDVLVSGNLHAQLATTQEAAAYARQRIALLPPEHLRFDNPHTYKVGVTKPLLDLRSDLYNSLRARIED